MTYAILPVSEWSPALAAALMAAGVLFLCALVRWRHQPRASTAAQLVAALLLGCFFLVQMLLPPVAESRRDHYKDKDQYEWARDLHHEDEAQRGDAVEALCHLLKSPETSSKRWIIQQLGKTGPNAREALPVLREFLKSEDPTIREKAIFAIQQITPDEESQREDGEREDREREAERVESGNGVSDGLNSCQ